MYRPVHLGLRVSARPGEAPMSNPSMEAELKAWSPNASDKRAHNILYR